MHAPAPRHEAGGKTSAIDGEASFDADLSTCSRDRRVDVDTFLRPRAIALVGASANPNTIAGLLSSNLVASPFVGSVFPINTKHRVVQGVDAYPDLASCPIVPDLVFVCVPAAFVARVVIEAGDLGIKAVCVISAGFAETGADGALLQSELLHEARARGVTVIGPNCTGILAGTDEARFNATFSRTLPSPGRTALLTHSGAIGLAVMEAVDARRIGIGDFVSVGNDADVVSNDILLHWGDDRETDLILCYLESIPDPARFIRVARSVGRRTPIVVVKAGRGEAGHRAAASHTAALSGSDAATDALLHQAGVIRAESIEEMLDVASVLTTQQRFRGRRVAIVTNGGGPGTLAADACESNALVVPSLAEETTKRLRALLPDEASVSNPVDMIASATARQYGEAVRVLGTSPEIDALFVVYNTPLLTRSTDVASELIAARAELADDTAMVTVFMNQEGPPTAIRSAGIPSFAYPENAARAVGRSIAWAERRHRDAGERFRLAVDAVRVRDLVAAARRRSDGGWMATHDAEALLAAYGIPRPRSLLVRSPREAEAAQAALDCPVVVKVAAPIHKSEVGGVLTGVTTPSGAGEAVRAIRASLKAAEVGKTSAFLVQEEIASGLEMIVGMNRDPALGPLVMVGLGGKFVEVLADVALRLAPLGIDDVDEMLRSLKAYRLLTGFRDTPVLDVYALCDVVLRVSALGADVDEIAEMDLNPVFVLEAGAVAADVRIRVSD